MLALAALVGFVAGIGAVVFHLLSQSLDYWAVQRFVGYIAGEPKNEHNIAAHLFGESSSTLRPWLLLIVPAIGGLLAGILVYGIAPEAEGHGTDAAIRAFHRDEGRMRARAPIVKILASAITLGTGGSGGREGPIAQIGAGFGSILATKLKLSDANRRTLLVAGVGAGIGSIFHAPLAGAIFSVEVLYRDPEFESGSLIPCFIATSVAYTTFAVILGMCFGYDEFGALFAIPQALRFNQPLLIIPLTVMTLLVAGAAMFYVRTFYSMVAFFRRMPIPRFTRPAVGGLCTGAFAIAIYFALSNYGPTTQKDALGVLGFGYGLLQRLLDPEQLAAMPLVLLLAVGLGKILTTSFTIGSGGSGGVFAPSMVIGASFGAAAGLISQHMFPSIIGTQHLEMFVLLGMAGFFSAAANTPVSSLIMVCELTGSYALLLPAMWVCALAYVLGRSSGLSIYHEQLNSRLDSPAHRSQTISTLLSSVQVHDVLEKQPFSSIPLDMSLPDIMSVVADTRQSCFPVTDADGHYVGMFSLDDVRSFYHQSDPFTDLVIATDLARPVQPLTMNTDLDEVMRRFTHEGVAALPVLDTKDTKKVVALFYRADLFAEYNQHLKKHREEMARTRGSASVDVTPKG